MKKAKFIIAIMFFACLTACGQTKLLTVTGKITEVRPYNEQYAMTVHDTNLVLITDLDGTHGTSFEVNKKYKDILVKHEGKYELNPKYAGRNYKITYYLNGKGWKCIKTIAASK